jgi:glycerol-3-phosphate dehydrogenase (NAD(P)+)
MIAVLGAGSMGSAIAIHLLRAGEQVMMFATDHDEAAVRAWRDQRPHPGLGIVVDEGVAVRDLATAGHLLGAADVIAVAVSCHGLAPVLSSIAGQTSPHATWVLATKGWQEDTLQTPSELTAAYVGPHSRLVTLAGPALASEVAAGLPTAFLFASRDADARRLAARTFAAPSMLTVTTSDVIGAETASAYKNVAAIAVGIAEGLSKRFARSGAPETFANARAAMFAQGMIDTVRLAEVRGGRATTVLGLAGAGDLYVTCVGGRNGRFGRMLGSGTTMEEALRTINSTVEGISNTRAALGLAERHSVDLRTARTVDFALHHHLIGDEAVQAIRDLFTATMTPSSR